MEKSDLEARYDDNAKDLTAQKSILAHILVATMEEYKGLSPKEVIPLIEGEPKVKHDCDRMKLSPKITGMSTVLSEAGGGRIELDIRFFVWTPDRSRLSEKSVKIIANVEIQNQYNPGYDIANRQVVSSCRMVTDQKNREYSGDDYDGLKKVTSIWIFTNPKKKYRSTITKYSLLQTNIYGNCPEENYRYDKLNIVNIGLPKDTKENIKEAKGIHKLLAALYSKTLSLEEKKDILEHEFGIKMFEETEGKVNEMCNLSLDIRYEGIREGIREGRREGRREERNAIIRIMLNRGYSEETIYDLGFTQDDIARARQGSEEEE